MKIYDMDNKCYVNTKEIKNPKTKIEQLSHVLYCFENDIFDVVYDKSQPALVKYINSLNQDILYQDGMQFLYFTSGTTGLPTGVFKTKENSIKQAEALLKTLGDRKFNRVVTTVPFVHIYGVDIGAVVPKLLDIDIWTKENFLPEELVLEAEKEGTLIVTTPVFIKALNRIKKDVNLSGSYFLTSTAPVPKDDGKKFFELYNTSVSQLFASTETGLMGHKIDDEEILKTYDGVVIDEKYGMLRVSSPFVTQKILNDGVIEEVKPPFQTEDIVEILSESEFKLLGRSSNLAKIAGKRISTQQIEGIIEAMDEVECVLIKIRRDERALKDEILDIYVESKIGLDAKVLRKTLKEHFGAMNIAFKIFNNVKITRSSVGKKIGFKEL
ncbi:MAG: acyl--CoA ligase [Epsilonproteobacteria bacterium]|nr:acyl--CoA ligase [Campylobacterota bacterium]